MQTPPRRLSKRIDAQAGDTTGAKHHQQRREIQECRRQEGQSSILLDEQRNGDECPGEESPERRKILAGQLQEKEDGNQNGQRAVAIIKGMRKTE